MKYIFITSIIILFNLMLVGQTSSTGEGEWAVVMSSNTTPNPEPGGSGTYYDVGSSDNFVIDDNVYTTSSGIDGISLDWGAELTVGDEVAGGSDTLTINGTILTANSSTTTINEGDVIIVNGDLRDNRSGNLIVNGTLKVTGDVLNQESSDITVGENGTILVGGDFTNSGSGSTVVNNGAIDVGGTYSGTYTGNDPADGLGASEALPIELVSFNAYESDSKIILQWTTAIELNNDYFTIERSADGILYEVIAQVAGAGNSYTSLNYSYTDKNPLNGVSYYRLSQTDYNGAIEVFNPVSVSFLKEANVSIGPNPASSYLNVLIDGERATNTVNIYNLIGAQVKSIEVSESNAVIDISDLPRGAYMVVLQAESTKFVRRIILQ